MFPPLWGIRSQGQCPQKQLVVENESAARRSTWPGFTRARHHLLVCTAPGLVVVVVVVVEVLLYVHIKTSGTLVEVLLYVNVAYQGREPSSSFQCCFTSTETVRTVRDGEPKDGHLDFHTAPELFVSVLLYVHRDRTDC